MKLSIVCIALLLLAGCSSVPLHTNHGELKNVKAAIADARSANAEACAPAELAAAVAKMYWAAHEIEEGMHMTEIDELIAGAIKSAKKAKTQSAINCKPKAKKVAPIKISLKGVNFHSGNADLTMNSKTILNSVVKKLKAYPMSVNLEVSAHTDSDGSATSNLRLSNLRAKSVMNYLVAHGIDPSTLVAKGYGEDKPIADNKTAAGKAQNRRVELNIL